MREVIHRKVQQYIACRLKIAEWTEAVDLI